MNYRSILLALLCGAVLVPPAAVAQGSPVQLSLFAPVQIVPEHQSISALRLSLIYGKNANMTGFDMGLVTKTTGSLSGVQWGFVGTVDGNSEGWQSNLVSITNGSFTGLQTGLYASSGQMHGLQIGLVNSAGTMKGIQLGLLNFISKGGWMSFFPIINWGGL